MTQYSDDGRWWWDGQGWQPVQQPLELQPQLEAPTPPASRRTPALRRRRRGLRTGLAIGALALVVGAGTVAAMVARGIRSPAVPRATALASSAAPAPRQVDSAKVTVTPASEFAHFSSGIFRVGQDVRPGTYRLRSGSDGCYFARLKSFGGSTDDILANDAAEGPAVVTILPTDTGFQSDHCGTWTSDLSPIVRNSSFGPGDYIVGTDLQPGTYRNRGGGQACYYTRLRGFTHASGDIIANNNTQGTAIVTVGASDRGFSSTGCGTWFRLG